MKKTKSNDLVDVTALSTLLLFFTFLGIFTWLNYFNIGVDLLNTYYIIIIIIIIGVVNFFVLIKPKKFLNKDFNKDIKGGVIVILIIILIMINLLVAIKYNRANIFNNSTIEKVIEK